MLEKKDYKTKVIKPTMKKATKKSAPKKPTRTFHFPLHGVSVEAHDQAGAQKKLSAIINQE